MLITFECLELETSFLVCRRSFITSRPSSSIKVIGPSSMSKVKVIDCSITDIVTKLRVLYHGYYENALPSFLAQRSKVKVRVTQIVKITFLLLTFECLDLETSFLLCRCIFIISRLISSMKVMGLKSMSKVKVISCSVTDIVTKHWVLYHGCYEKALPSFHPQKSKVKVRVTQIVKITFLLITWQQIHT